MAKKNARGGGTIRKKTVTRSGREYTYWESRLTVGRDPGTGKQLQRSFTGKTQKEVREKMQAAAVEVNQGTYTAPQRLTVGQWLYIWAADYLGPLKPCTVRTYRGAVRNHIAPGLGAVRLVELHPHMVQEFVNGLELAPGFVRLVFQVLHTALEKAVDLDYIPRNPAARCELPRRDRREMYPLDDGQLTALLDAARGRSLEHLVTVALFTGLRQSELLGLTWNAVDFERGTVTVDKQLSRTEHRAGGLFTSPKSGKARVVMAAPSALAALRHQRARQAEAQLRAGPLWANPHRLVFTTALGGPLDQRNVDYHFRHFLLISQTNNHNRIIMAPICQVHDKEYLFQNCGRAGQSGQHPHSLLHHCVSVKGLSQTVSINLLHTFARSPPRRSPGQGPPGG